MKFLTKIKNSAFIILIFVCVIIVGYLFFYIYNQNMEYQRLSNNLTKPQAIEEIYEKKTEYEKESIKSEEKSEEYFDSTEDDFHRNDTIMIF